MASSLPDSALALVSTILLVSRVAYTEGRCVRWWTYGNRSHTNKKYAAILCTIYLIRFQQATFLVFWKDRNHELRCNQNDLLGLPVRYNWDVPSISAASPSSSSSSSSSAPAQHAADVAFIFLSLTRSNEYHYLQGPKVILLANCCFSVAKYC